MRGRERVTDATAGPRYDRVTGRHWKDDARMPLLAAALVTARDVVLRRAAVSVRRVTGGRAVKVRALASWAVAVLDAEATMLAQDPILAAFTASEVRAVLLGKDAPEVGDPLPPGLLTAVHDLLTTTENASRLAPRFFWEAAILQAGVAGRPIPTPAEVAMLAAASRFESLGGRGLERTRWRWETRIARWRLAEPALPGVAELLRFAALMTAIRQAGRPGSRDLREYEKYLDADASLVFGSGHA